MREFIEEIFEIVLGKVNPNAPIRVSITKGIVPILRQWKEQITKDESQNFEIKSTKTEIANKESQSSKIIFLENILNNIIKALKVQNEELAISKIDKLRKMTKEYRGLINKTKLLFHLPINAGRPPILRLIYKSIVDQSSITSQAGMILTKSSRPIVKNSFIREKSGILEMKQDDTDIITKSMPIIRNTINSQS